jgi:hypothetical protein
MYVPRLTHGQWWGRLQTSRDSGQRGGVQPAAVVTFGDIELTHLMRLGRDKPLSLSRLLWLFMDLCGSMGILSIFFYFSDKCHWDFDRSALNQQAILDSLHKNPSRA